MPFPPVIYDHAEFEKLNVILQIFYPVSGVVLLFLIFTMIKFRVQTRFMSRGCLLNFFAIELIDVLQGLLFAYEPSNVTEIHCRTLGFIAHFLQLSSIGWTTCLAYQTYMIYCVDSSLMDASLLRWYVQIYGLAAALCSVGIAIGAYGDVGNHFCWILNPVIDIWLFWVYMAVNVAMSSFLVYRIFQKLQNDFVGSEDNRRKSVIRTAYFVGLIVVSWILMAIVRGAHSMLSEFPTALAYAYAFISSTIGAIYALAFFVHSNLWQLYKAGTIYGEDILDEGGDVVVSTDHTELRSDLHRGDSAAPRTFASLVASWRQFGSSAKWSNASVTYGTSNESLYSMSGHHLSNER